MTAPPEQPDETSAFEKYKAETEARFRKPEAVAARYREANPSCGKSRPARGEV